MWPLIVVITVPLLGYPFHFLYASEDVRVKYNHSVTAIEPLYISVLGSEIQAWCTECLCRSLCTIPGNPYPETMSYWARRLFQRCLDPCRKAFLQTDTFLVVHILVHTVNLLVVPLLSFTSETFEFLPETLSVLGCRPYIFFHLSVISLLLIIVIRTVDLHQPARPSDAQFVFLYNLYCYLFLYLGL